MSKLAWLLLPPLLAAVWLVWLAWRGRPPARSVMNVWFSVLLLAYLATTAGLGIFWVANQQLPAFDWHYVFGYATLLLLAVHLAFNFRVVWRHLTRRSAPSEASLHDAAQGTGRRPLLAGLGFGAGIVGAYWLGLRHGRTELQVDAAAATAGADWVERFHEFSAHSRSGVFRRAPNVDWGEPPPPFKAYDGFELLRLPAPAEAVNASGSLDIATLASLLWHTAAVNLVRGSIHFRTAPSSGALFATELYVATHDVAGLRSGLWHYDARRHALRRLGEAPADSWALGSPLRAKAHLVATAVFRRSGHKYRDRCYRYVLADLGHALENLRASAAALAVPARFETAFDESRAASTLGLDEAAEGVLALVGLEPAEPASATATAAWSAAPLSAGTALGVTEAIHRATSLRANPLAPVGLPAAAGAPQPAERAGGVALPTPHVHRVGALEAIARRRSIRRYAGTAIAQDALSALLDAAVRRAAPIYSDAVRISVLTQAVQDLPQAAWRYRREGHQLQKLGVELTSRERSQRAALDQAVIGDAALVVVLSIDRAAFAADALGAGRGYRHAFLEAGMVGERLYLEGIALGLGVCAVGAFYDDEATALIGVDPAREWVVHFTALGVPG